MYYTGQMNADEAVWRLTEVVRCKHLTPASKRISRLSIRRYCEVLQGLPQHLRGEHKLERFLTVLAQKAAAVKTCSPSRRNSSPEVICAYNSPRNLSEKWVVRATRPDRSATCRPEWRSEAVLPGRRELGRTAASVPSGESPDGTGGSPVPPIQAAEAGSRGPRNERSRKSRGATRHTGRSRLKAGPNKKPRTACGA